jgi:undecaprenyl-diphosphatase
MVQPHTAEMGPLAKLHQWDVLILNRVFQGTRYRQKLTQVMAAVSRTGDGPLYVMIAAAVWFAELPRAQAFCSTLILAFAIERPLYFLLKNSLKRNRPEQVVPGVSAVVVPADQFSFPSGHTSAAFCFATIAGILLLGPYNPFFLWATAIALSRVVLAVHFPCDVIAGAMIGSAIAAISGFLVGTF